MNTDSEFMFGVRSACDALLNVAIHGPNNEGDVTCKDIEDIAWFFGVNLSDKEVGK